MDVGEILSRIHAYTNDVILISEAEPVGEPGPRVVFANKAFEVATGYSVEYIIGKTPRVLQGPETSLETRERIRKSLKM